MNATAVSPNILSYPYAARLPIRKSDTKMSYCSRLHVCIMLLLFVAAHRMLHAQQLTAFGSGLSLPNAPEPQTALSQQHTGPSEPANLPAGDSSINGTVVDSAGAVIPGAVVSLMGESGQIYRSDRTDPNGSFSFKRIPAGTYKVRAAFSGFGVSVSDDVTVAAEQNREELSIALRVAADTSIVVRPTEVIAEEQIKAEERQRFLGIVPNFYMSFEPNPAPMTTKQKFRLAARDTFDWTSFVGVSFTAGIEQANNSFAGYGQGAAGYGKRWAAQFGDGRISDFMDHAVFASLFHEDPRYFYQGTGTKKSRIYHAVANAFVTRGDNGKMMPNYSYVLGMMVAGAASNAYYPHADRGANLVFTNAALGIAGRAGANVLRELFAKRLTTNVPTSSIRDNPSLRRP